jgi:hypothetical protein
MKTLEVKFEFREKEEVTWTQLGEYRGCENTGILLLLKHSLTEMEV